MILIQSERTCYEHFLYSLDAAILSAVVHTILYTPDALCDVSSYRCTPVNSILSLFGAVRPIWAGTIFIESKNWKSTNWESTNRESTNREHTPKSVLKFSRAANTTHALRPYSSLVVVLISSIISILVPYCLIILSKAAAPTVH